MSDDPFTRPEPVRKRRRVEALRPPVISTPSFDQIKKENGVTKKIQCIKNDGIRAAAGLKTSLWVNAKKTIFFEALHEFGKNFEKIHNYFNLKIKKLYGNVETNHVLKKEQIKDFYANTLKKASNCIDTKRLHHLIADDSSIEEQRVKEYRELIVLSSWWQVMKHEKKTKYSSDKLKTKINQLTFNGHTVLRIKKHNVHITQQLPKCLSQKARDKVPPEFTIDILPHNNWSWSVVQNIAQNPRIRLKVSSKKSVCEIVQLLMSKWERAGEQCSNEPLMLYLHSPPPEPAENKRRTSFTTPCEKKRTNIAHSKTPQPSGSPESNQTEKNNQTPNKSDEIESNGPLSTSVKSNGLVFTALNEPSEHTLSHSASSETELDQSLEEEGSEVAAEEEGLVGEDGESVECEEGVLEEVFELSVLEEITVEQLGDKPVNGHKKNTEFSDMLFGRKGSNRKENEEELKERQRLVELARWSKDTPATLTIGHIYAEFCGKDKKEFYIEYEWRSADNLVNSAQNCLALKRLFNLASTEFQKLSRQSRYQDLFMTVNVEQWKTPVRSVRHTETQTNELLFPKVKSANVAVQAGKERLILPLPTKLGGFLVPSSSSSTATTPNKKEPSFTLPKRPPKKRSHRAILPKICPSTTTIQIVVPNQAPLDPLTAALDPLTTAPTALPSTAAQYYPQDAYYNDWDANANDPFFAQFNSQTAPSPLPLGLDYHNKPPQPEPPTTVELRVPVIDEDSADTVHRGDHGKMITLLHCDNSLL